MGDLSKNFSRSEFACQGDNCCDHSSPVHPHLVHCLQFLRNIISVELNKDIPLTISSGFRCIKHNEHIQKQYNKDYIPYSSKSRHTYGDAVDVMCPDELSVDEFYQLALRVNSFKMGGIGKYPNRLHLDIRGDLARWDVR